MAKGFVSQVSQKCVFVMISYLVVVVNDGVVVDDDDDVVVVQNGGKFVQSLFLFPLLLLRGKWITSVQFTSLILTYTRTYQCRGHFGRGGRMI